LLIGARSLSSCGHGGDYADAVATSEQLGSLAITTGDPKTIATYRRLAAVASTFAGDHAAARDHAQYVLNHPSSQSGKTRLFGMFFDQRISARCSHELSGSKDFPTR
jgi:hypothetical protein